MNQRDCEHGRQIGKCCDCDVLKLEAENESLWMDAKRLAMELECLMHDCDLAAVSKWWDSAHEALELHRQLIQEKYK